MYLGLGSGNRFLIKVNLDRSSSCQVVGLGSCHIPTKDSAFRRGQHAESSLKADDEVVLLPVTGLNVSWGAKVIWGAKR